MKVSIGSFSSLVATGLLALGFVVPAWGQQCLPPTPLEPPEAANLITEFDGNMTCGTGQFGCSIPDGGGLNSATCTAFNSDSTKYFRVRSTIGVDKKAYWNIEPDGSNILGIDGLINNNGPGGGAKGCLYSFGIDAVSGTAAYEKSNRTIATIQSLTFCADSLSEPVPPPAPIPLSKVQACELDSSGNENVEIYGVSINCMNVPAGEDREIFVVRKTYQDPNSGQVVNDRNFGFANIDGVDLGVAGDIDLSNICRCVGNTTVPEESQCDPDPNVINNPEIDALDPCVLGPNAATVPTSIEFQNPIKVCSGGSCRYY